MIIFVGLHSFTSSRLSSIIWFLKQVRLCFLGKPFSQFANEVVVSFPFFFSAINLQVMDPRLVFVPCEGKGLRDHCQQGIFSMSKQKGFSTNEKCAGVKIRSPQMPTVLILAFPSCMKHKQRFLFRVSQLKHALRAYDYQLASSDIVSSGQQILNTEMLDYSFDPKMKIRKLQGKVLEIEKTGEFTKKDGQLATAKNGRSVYSRLKS